MIRRLAVTTAIALVVVGVSADADVRRKGDRSDVKGPLDIRNVGHGHGRRGRLVHTLRMYEPWDNSTLENQSSWIAFMFDRKEESFRDGRFLKVDYSEARGLYAFMTRAGIHGPGERIGRVHVWRPAPRTLKVRFPTSYLGRRVPRYEWAAIASFEDEEACSSPHNSGAQGGCIDYSPGKRERRIVHVLH